MPQHRRIENPPPCRACAEAREARQRFDAEQAARRERVAADIDRAKADPDLRCEHGTDGGRYPHPNTDLSATCALCRSAQSLEVDS